MKRWSEYRQQHLLAIFWLLGVCSFSGCLSEIALDVPEEDSSSIVIRGTLLDGEVPLLSVRITNLSNFKATDIPRPVIGASVVLIDEDNRGVDIPMREAGVYELIIPDSTYDLEVKPGKSYQLSVSTAEGKNYLSTLETLYPVPAPAAMKIDSVQRAVINEVGNIVNQKFLRFLLTTPVVNPDNSGKSYLKWRLLGTYKFTESVLDVSLPPKNKTCYFFENLNLEKVVVFNGVESSRDVLADFFLLEEPKDYRFSEGFYLSVFQQSLSEGAYRYWEEVGKVVDMSGNFFEAPPGKVKGNFHNVEDDQEEVFGYFYPTQEVVFRFYVAPGENRVRPFCPGLVKPDDETVPSVCLNCLIRLGSTTTKPDFWER